ncbi:MAG: hypothetical protein M1825_003340 [Sarcosagium campestre]|nr:MAG: hypothetical protein M1825_003340 [Sarcosagium campestre]
MNSLNLLSARIIGPTPPQSPSTKLSPDHDAFENEKTPFPKGGLSEADSQESNLNSSTSLQLTGSPKGEKDTDGDGGDDGSSLPSDESTPLLNGKQQPDFADVKPSAWALLPQRAARALIATLKLLFSALATPGIYIGSFFYDDKGHFSPLSPFRNTYRMILRPRGGRSTSQAVGLASASADGATTKPTRLQQGHGRNGKPSRRRAMSGGSAITGGSESESEREKPTFEAVPTQEKAVLLTRSKSDVSDSTEEGTPTRRSIRIKLSNAESRAHRRSTSSESQDRASLSSDQPPSLTPATIKSPTSTSSSLRMTKYPRAPAPPRPLIPRRVNSYSLRPAALPQLAQKTLILDLDETLIHSLAKGGRMSTGHMVEVKLNAPVGLGGGVALAPQHPILYYVHKRPHCDDFLRKVSKWYNLVVFTASVQEYADPVIDWLEQDRKYFSERLYRQHCTFRGGNYIKDISCVEPDLSKVMIVDNSPSSYVFHEDNAVPIEGWINDPTDNDLLHLIPLLEALQYVTDVRALLALRMGESTAG